jgi:putative flippase GtrA
MWSRFKGLYDRYSSPELWRYLVIAVVLVGVEVVTFQLMLWAGISYLIATPVSMIIAIVLNWLLSRLWVFKHRPHRSAKEFTLVVIASVIGLALQLAVTIFVVQVAHGAPLLGKLIAIGVTFFWNFWFRKKYIFFDPASREVLP